MQVREYHHGDLRNALVQAGLSLLERDGPAAVGLRSVAREVGVSQAAPYAHFEGKRALMSAIAAVGFARLRDLIAPLASDPACRLSDLGVAYIHFATTNPGLYSLMFGSSEHIDAGTEDLSRASREALELLAKKTARKGSAAILDPGPIAAWSLVHGFATLLMNEKVPRSVHEILPEILQVLEPGIAEHMS
jgi:AcrR family transcriptional regulator